MERVPSAPAVGLRASEEHQADHVLIGHFHFDHLWGAKRIAHNTGATGIGSHETVRLMQLEEVPDAQLIPVSGGERIRLSDTVTARVFPSQHSCIWSSEGSILWKDTSGHWTGILRDLGPDVVILAAATGQHRWRAHPGLPGPAHGPISGPSASAESSALPS